MEYDDFEPTGFGDHLSSESPRARKRRDRRNRGRRIFILVVIVLILFGGLAYAGYRLSVAFVFSPKDSGGKGVGLFQSRPEERTMNILMFGTDEREKEQARSDTIILAVLDLKRQTANLLSIPRDTRVEIPGEAKENKINFAHAKGGPQLAAKTVENFLGMPVDGYVETNFEGFQEIIDTLGGVTINVEQRMYKPSESINLKPGLQRLDGKDALAYVRWRGDALADIGRVKRQQKFFLAVADEVLQVNNIWKLPDLVGEFRANVKTDLTLKEMLRVAGALKNMDRANIHTFTVPGDPEYVDDISYWIPREVELEQMVEQIKSPGNSEPQQAANE